MERKTEPYHRNKSLSAVVLETDTETRSRLWREWLDSFYLAQDKETPLQEEPPLTGTVWDAIAAAGVAWLARKAQVSVPAWTKSSKRCARIPWWGEFAANSRSAAINQVLAPPEFFSRNLFVSAKIMYRARMPADWIEKEPLFFTRLAQQMASGRSSKT
ncbi:MAG: hypothetical protein K6G15_09325 [Desulfovibrio sp.]|nr:hypothetical protein [Desulfovibrio sp.]